MSLTYYIKKARSEEKGDYFRTDHIKPPRIPRGTKVVNPYPVSIGKRRLWGLMGTFTDYMIRKMFRDGLVSPQNTVIPESGLIASQGYQMVANLLVQPTDEKALERIVRNGNDWIAAYKEREWSNCIEDTFLMSQLEAVYRTGRAFSLHDLTPDEVEDIRVYLERILEWLQKEFSDAKQVVLNPLYGHPDICNADGDIIIDGTLFEIKTTVKPSSLSKNEKDQLLGYMALSEHHRQVPIETSPPEVEYKSIGYMLPLSLLVTTAKIDGFPPENRIKFCSRITELCSTEISSLKVKEKRKGLQLDRETRWVEPEVEARKHLEEGTSTLIEWKQLLTGLAEDGKLDRVVSLVRYLEENEHRLQPWEPIFGSDYKDDLPCLFFNIGTYLAWEGDLEYALHCFSFYSQRTGTRPEDDWILAGYLALIHARLGDAEQSASYWARMGEVKPAFQPLKEKIKQRIDEAMQPDAPS